MMILCIIIVSVFVIAYRIKLYVISNSDIIFLQGEKDEIIKFCNPMLQFKGLHGALYRVYPAGWR